MIEIAIFDMDHTVLDIDCDLSWKYFLADEGLAPPDHRAEAERFFDLYHRGETPVDEYVEFQLREFVNRSIEEMKTIADRHFEQRVRKYIFPQAREVIDDFNRRDIATTMLTGTNRIIAEPIARSLGINRVIATEPEIKNGRFSGRISGPFLMKEAKLKSASDLCASENIELERVTYYADSITDVALLEKVRYPVVINPRENLRTIAEANQWQIENWQLEAKSASFPRVREEIGKVLS